IGENLHGAPPSGRAQWTRSLARFWAAGWPGFAGRRPRLPGRIASGSRPLLLRSRLAHQEPEGFVGVLVGPDAADDRLDAPLLVDEEGGAVDAHVGAAEHALRLQHPVGLGHLPLRVR